MATSLSAGLIIRDALINSDVATIATKIYPVIADSATLPYVTYRCMATEQQPTKQGQTGSDTVRVCVACYAKTYADCVALSEKVRCAIDCQQHTLDSLKMRACYLTDSNDAWEDDAFVKELIFTIRI